MSTFTCSLCGDAVPHVMRDSRKTIAESDRMLHDCTAFDGRKLPRGKHPTKNLNAYAWRRQAGTARHLLCTHAGLPLEKPALFHAPPPVGCYMCACPLWDELEWFVFIGRDPKPSEKYARGVFIPVDAMGNDLTHLSSTEVRAYLELTKSKFDTISSSFETTKVAGEKGEIWVKAPEFLAAIGTTQYMARPRPVCVKHP